MYVGSGSAYVKAMRKERTYVKSESESKIILTGRMYEEREERLNDDRWNRMQAEQNRFVTGFGKRLRSRNDYSEGKNRMKV